MSDLDTYPRVNADGICIHGLYLHLLCQIADEALRFSWTIKDKRKKSP